MQLLFIPFKRKIIELSYRQIINSTISFRRIHDIAFILSAIQKYRNKENNSTGRRIVAIAKFVSNSDI